MNEIKEVKSLFLNVQFFFMFKSLTARIKLSGFILCFPHLTYITLDKQFKLVDSILSSVHEDDNTIYLMELVRGLMS